MKPHIVDLTRPQQSLYNRDQDQDEAQVVQEPKEIEREISMLKIRTIQRFHEKTLYNNRGVSSDVGEDGSYSVNRPQSLSVYDGVQRKTYTSFSKVLSTPNCQNNVEKHISDAHDIKKKLANFRMKVSIKALESSLLPTIINNQNQASGFPNPGKAFLLIRLS